MHKTIKLAQRVASVAAAKPKAAPLPYAPPRLQNADASQRPLQTLPTRQTPTPQASTTSPAEQPRKKVEVGSPEYKQAANKYTRAMIAMPVLLLTSYVLYNRFLGGEEAKTIRGIEEPGPKLVVLDRSK